MARRLISSGSRFEREIGYSRAVVDREWIFVSGTTGFDYRTMAIDPDPAVQARQTFANVSAALAEAGASLADVVRVHYYAMSLADWERMIPVLADHFGDIRPAATMLLVAGLADPRIKIEIEVTAKRRS
jgi:enamine deaminase RidA (YjgF/YER057c/UK114 family)